MSWILCVVLSIVLCLALASKRSPAKATIDYSKQRDAWRDYALALEAAYTFAARCTPYTGITGDYSLPLAEWTKATLKATLAARKLYLMGAYPSNCGKSPFILSEPESWNVS